MRPAGSVSVRREPNSQLTRSSIYVVGASPERANPRIARTGHDGWVQAQPGDRSSRKHPQQKLGRPTSRGAVTRYYWQKRQVNGARAGPASSPIATELMHSGEPADRVRMGVSWTQRISYPLMGMAEVNGLLVDLRDMPREVQEIAFARGLIPYIPADRKDRS